MVSARNGGTYCGIYFRLSALSRLLSNVAGQVIAKNDCVISMNVLEC